MFKNREFRTQIVKTSNQPAAPKEPRTTEDVLFITAIVRNNVKFVVGLAGAAYVGKKLADTLSEIAQLAAEAKLK